MKTLRIITAILFACSFTGCNNESEIIKTSPLIEVKARPINLQTDRNDLIKATTVSEVVFTINDIESYNGKTGEIIFNNTGNNESFSSILNRFSERLNFYMDETLLFSLKSKIVTDIESAIYNEPILHYSILNGGKYFISDGYPWGLPVDDSTTTRTGQAAKVEEIRKTNASKIEEGWSLFVDALKKENKYFEE
jgi:hypothetical protein